MLVMLSEILRPTRFPVLFQMTFLRFLDGLGILDIFNIITQGMTGEADFFADLPSAEQYLFPTHSWKKVET